MTLEALLNLKRLTIEGIFLTIPDSIILILFGLLFTGYKSKIVLNRMFVFAIICAIFDIIIRFFLEQYGVHSTLLIIIAIVFVSLLFKLDLITSILCTVIGFFSIFILQLVYFSICSYCIGIDFANFISLVNSSNKLLLKIVISYIYFILSAILFIFLYFKNIILINLQKYKLFSSLKSKNSIYLHNIKFTLTILLPTFIFILINFSIYYYNAFNEIHKTSPFLYFSINTIAIIILNIIMFFLVRKNVELKYYKLEYNTQKQYLEDIDTLIKGLRQQKHGFNNHINNIQGYLLLGYYDKANAYIQDISHICINKHNIIDVDNPAVNALLNVKLSIAEDKDIKFEVVSTDDISNLNFKTFEIGEAVGNIIDNAIEATSKYENNKHIKISLGSDNNYYIFNISNTGKTIPHDMLNKIFEEGYTTKNYEYGEHGMGLYISKIIIENNKGKIEVESMDDITTFKIYLPKVKKNESKVS